MPLLLSTLVCLVCFLGFFAAWAASCDGFYRMAFMWFIGVGFYVIAFDSFLGRGWSIDSYYDLSGSLLTVIFHLEGICSI